MHVSKTNILKIAEMKQRGSTGYRKLTEQGSIPNIPWSPEPTSSAEPEITPEYQW